MDSIETNVIHNESCIDTLSRLPDNCIDVIFADPPFNIGKRYKGGYNDNRDDYFQWQDEWVKECFRCLKKTGTLYLMTIDRNLPETLSTLSKYGQFISLIKWRNMSASHSKRNYWSSTQPIAMFSKSDSYKFNTYAETRDTFDNWSKERNEKMKGQLTDYWDDIPNVYAGSIKHKEAILQKGTNKKAHLAQMPEKLPGRAILFSSDPGDIVYDPFIGSGTTAAAAYKLGRKYIGSEVSEEYHQLATDRINKITTEQLF